MKHVSLILAAFLLLAAGCRTIDKKKLFEGLGEPETVYIEGHTMYQVYKAALKVTRGNFHPSVESASNGVIYTDFTKHAYDQRDSAIAEVYMKKAIIALDELRKNNVVMKIQVAAFRIDKTPSGFRDQRLHDAIKNDIMDELKTGRK